MTLVEADWPGRDRLLRDPSLRLLESSGEQLLTRADGLLVRLGRLAWSFLNADKGDGLQAVIEAWGIPEVKRCDDELNRLADKVGGFDAGLFDLIERPRGRPGGLVLMVAQACNLSCSYCFGEGGQYGSAVRRMSYADACRSVDTMIARGTGRRRFKITFFGGEPLLSFRLITEVVSYCEQVKAEAGVDFLYSITTNGTIMSAEILELLKSKRFGVMVSLDGPAAVHDSNRPFRNGRGSYDLVLRNLKEMISAGIAIQLRATLTKGAVDNDVAYELLQIARKLRVERVVMVPVDSSKMSSDRSELSPCEMDSLEELADEVLQDQLDQARAGNVPSVHYSPHASLLNQLARGTAQGVGRCGACQGMAAVATDGSIYPCHRFVGMEAYRIGHLDTGIDDVRVSAFFRAVQQSYEAACGNCWARQICHGTCFYRAADGDGGFHPPSPESCARYRKGIEKGFGWMAKLKAEDPSTLRRLGVALRQF